MIRPFLLLLNFLFIFSNIQLNAQIRLPFVLSDNMVVQRNQPITIWGWATPGTSLTIEMNEQRAKAQTDLAGKWQADLPAMSAGGPYELTILSGVEKKVLKNVMVGDVWLCSGQSNMEWVMKNSDGFLAAKEQADCLPNIRHFKVPLASSLLPTDTLAGGKWESGSATTVSDFTAVGYYFAQKLRTQEPHVAIGLLNSSWGGSRIEPWMNAQTLGYKDAEQQAELTRQRAIATQRKQRKEIKKVFPVLPSEDRGMDEETAVWAATDLNTTDWQTMSLPQLWENYGEGYLKDLDGVVWFRKTLELTAEQAAPAATLYAGKIDDSDYTYVNGKLVGSMLNSYSEQRKYQVAADVLQAGKNVITIRVIDTGGGGGIYGKNTDLQLVTSAGTIDLTGNWQFNLGQYQSELFGFSANQMPTLLYNAMIYPIQKFKLKGALWYQGESNAGSVEEAYLYREHLPNLIRQWRSEWNSGEFPFLFVSLANFMPADEQPTNSNWALIRESMTKTLDLPKTGQAITIDIGDADDIHPRNKKTVGERLALAAMHYAAPVQLTMEQERLAKLGIAEAPATHFDTCGTQLILTKITGITELPRPTVWQSPQFSDFKIDNNKIVVSFDSFGSTLTVADDDKIGGFAIAGADKQFRWAKAILKDGKVIVWNDEIKSPVAVRYAWSDNPAAANLFNAEGLPVTPFRTDKW